MNWINVYPYNVTSSNDFIRSVEVSGLKLCILKIGNDFYVVQNKCPHAGADLSKGWCVNGNIVCPYHRHEFDIKTGRGAEGQGNYIETYPIQLREDGLYIGIPKPWWKLW
jgi:3-phenylpropionate/trans-cinnamate dioxygenase ferredoxin subunit